MNSLYLSLSLIVFVFSFFFFVSFEAYFRYQKSRGTTLEVENVW